MWDLDGDGIWDTSPSNSFNTTHLYTSEGTFNVRMRVTDTVGASDTAEYPLVVYGASIPSTLLNCSGTLGQNGWYISSVNLTLTATAPAGINWTKYRIDNGVWMSYSSAFTISNNSATNTVEYYSRDNEGNSESINAKTLKIDTVAPVSSANKTGNVVMLACFDATSGFNSTKYRIDGGAWEDCIGGQIEVIESGNHTVEYYSMDNAGNVEAVKSISVDVLVEDGEFIYLLPIVILAIAIGAIVVIILLSRKKRRAGEGPEPPPLQ